MTNAAGNWITLILAAGKGTRMRSDLAKVLHEIRGRTLLDHVLDLARRLPTSRTIVVVGHQAEEVETRHAGPGIEFVLQEPQLGTGHAVMAASPLLSSDDPEADLLVLYGDVPLLRETTLRELMERHRLEGNGVTVLTARVPDPTGYGRILRDAGGRFREIVEDRDLAPEMRSIDEINSGIYAFSLKPLLQALARLRADNAQGEYYLTDALTAIREAGRAVGIVCLSDPEEISGINTVDQLREAEAILARREESGTGECAVCELLRKRADLVLERRDQIVALLCPEPYNSGHLWIVPERHLVSGESLTEAEARGIFALAQEAEGWLDESYHPQGFNHGYNSGRPGEHFTFEVIPRWSGDANFMPLIAGMNILPETIEGSRRHILEARARLRGAS